MTLAELKAEIDALYHQGCRPEFEVQISAMTGRLSNNSNIGINSIGRGIDWDGNRIIIQPSESLVEAEFAKRYFAGHRKDDQKVRLGR